MVRYFVLAQRRVLHLPGSAGSHDECPVNRKERSKCSFRETYIRRRPKGRRWLKRSVTGVLQFALSNEPESNLLEFEPKIADFGLAKQLDTGNELTQTGAVPMSLGEIKTAARDQDEAAALAGNSAETDWLRHWWFHAALEAREAGQFKRPCGISTG